MRRIGLNGGGWAWTCVMKDHAAAPPALPAPPLHLLFRWAEGWITQNEYGWAMPGFLALVLLIHAVLIAIPFVPGVEIGLSVLAAGGAEIAPLVWLATACGLTLAYAAGGLVPLAWLQKVLLDLHLTGAAQVVARFEALPPKGRVAFVNALLPRKYYSWIVRYRYVNLAVLINLPGNSVIGGGGGIAFVSGLSGTFRAPLAMLAIALATAPVPPAVWLFGWGPPFG